MQSATHAITSVITSNYIAQALTLYAYIKESNPDSSFLVMIVGEAIVSPRDLPEGPEWIYWDAIYDNQTRLQLASHYTPFELACVARGRFHHYMSTQRKFDKWIMLDTDIGVLADLNLFWRAMDSACIVLTPHASAPVTFKQAIPHESNILKSGIFNAGVVGMKRSETAEQASRWLSERLEAYGHASAHRQGTGLPNFYEFEFVDQIWLNLMYLYFRKNIKILDQEICNLGHWNLHQGELSLQEGHAYFNSERVLLAHFSGLPPKEALSQVSMYSQLYRQNESIPWAIMATQYLERLKRTKASCPSIHYSYATIQPRCTIDNNRLARNAQGQAKRLPKNLLHKFARTLKSPSNIVGVIKLTSWKLKRSFNLTKSSLINVSSRLSQIPDEIPIQAEKLFTRLSQKMLFETSSERTKIRSYKNKYQGKRCFIIATGPSLNSTNIQLLSGEHTFAVKSFILSGIEKFHVVPSFFCWSDRATLLDKMNLFPAAQPEGMICFFPFAIRRKVLSGLNWDRSKLCFIRDIYEWNVQKGIFSTEADHLLHCSGSVIIDYCIPLAIYMGFNPIYLVGCDQSSPGGVRHFDGNSTPFSGISTSWETINDAFEVVNKYACDHGIKIYNATNGGALNVFERVSLEEVMSDNLPN
jgi:hypothetical protein